HDERPILRAHGIVDELEGRLLRFGERLEHRGRGVDHDADGERQVLDVLEPLEVKYKLNKIAQVTGGQTFYIDSAQNIEAVYRQINEDLRSQYLLTYYSSNAESKDKWRKVEIKVEPSNLQARTISGYYP